MKERIQRFLKKAKSRAAFTLAETLTAVLIMLMAASVVAAGIPAAVNAYEKVVVASNAEVLLSTSISALRGEIAAAQEIIDWDSTSVTYISGSTGSAAKIYISSDSEDTEGILLQRYTDTNDLGKPGDAVRLVSKEASTSDLYVTYDSLEYDEAGAVIVFKNIAVKSASGGNTMSLRDVLSIRLISG